MSEGLDVFSVPMEELHAIVGSKNGEWLQTIEEYDADFLDEIDELYEDELEDGEEGVITIRDAIQQLIEGVPTLDAVNSTVYIYALEAFCRHLGSRLDNQAFQPPIRWRWIETVDEYLASIGFPLRMAILASGECPIPVPNDHGIPSAGCWLPTEFETALKQINLVSVELQDEELIEAMSNIQSWLQEAIRQGNDCLVGFYS